MGEREQDKDEKKGKGKHAGGLQDWSSTSGGVGVVPHGVFMPAAVN